MPVYQVTKHNIHKAKMTGDTEETDKQTKSGRL